MITVITLLKLKPSPNGQEHGERPFWKEHGPRYLEVWLDSVSKFVPKPHNIIVMTDSDELIARQVGDRNEEYYPIGRIVDAPGFWAKLEAFRYAPTGKTLYMDLDNVINGPLDELVALDPDPLIMLDDRRVPGLPNGSMILFDAERCRDIWTEYASNPRACEAYHVARGDNYWCAYDQAFIADEVRHQFGHWRPAAFQQLLPDGYILNALSELPTAADWKTARVIFGCGPNAKPHMSTHPAFTLDERSLGGW